MTEKNVFPLEDVWQKEFYHILTSLVPTQNNVSPSVGCIFSTPGVKIAGSVD